MQNIDNNQTVEASASLREGEQIDGGTSRGQSLFASIPTLRAKGGMGSLSLGIPKGSGIPYLLHNYILVDN